MKHHFRTRPASFIRWLGVTAWLLSLAPQPVWAASTPAGTLISNTATVIYSLGGTVQPPLTTVPATIRVDELIQAAITWQDTAPVAVNTPGTNDALTFLLANTGNGQEAFSLARTNGPLPLPAGNYVPLNGSAGSIYLESGLQPGFQATGPNADTAYVPGANDPDLAAGATQTVYVVSDTPAVATGIQGEVLLAAASLTPGAAGAAPGTSLAGLGQNGVFAVVGANTASVKGSYITSGIGLTVNKTVAGVVDPNGTAVLMPGAVLTYRIAVAITGSGTVSNLVITDPLPADTSYVANSIAVDGATKTDVADADNAQFAAPMGSTGTVSVSLGNVAAPANIVITFRATIN